MRPAETTDRPAPGEDQLLVEGFLAGAPEAQRRLMERLQLVARLLALFNRRRGCQLSRADLEDLAQDTQIKILEKLSTFRGEATLANWLYRFCLLEFANRIRRTQRAARVQISQETVEERGGLVQSPDPLDYEILDSALGKLGSPEADIVRLKHYEQLTFREIGKRLGLSPNTAKTQYYRGIAWLQRELRPYLRDMEE
jgi:RNA polymerase sigma-70 factor (ECF subfamily)